MGLFSGIKAIKAMMHLRNGGKDYLSIAQIVDMIINLYDASKNLSRQQYNDVYNMYMAHKQCKNKMLIDLDEYYNIASEIIQRFNAIAPYEKYCGVEETEALYILSQIQQED
jgi:hypothetical protein